MTNKLKNLFWLVLCLSLIGGYATHVSAQTGGKVLVASSSGKQSLKQSDVNGLIELYEWAFEARFTQEQRAEYQSQIEDDFRLDAAAARKTTDDMLSNFAKIRTLDRQTQEKVRREMISGFIPQLRKQPDNAGARLLLNIYDAAHNSGSASNAAETAETNESSDESETNSGGAGGDISNLVGKWVWGRSGSSTYTTGGALMGSNGSRHTYQFAANGAIEYTGIMNVMTGGCNMQIFKSAKGRASLSGNRLTINWSPASFSRADSCSPSKDYKKTLLAETETFKVNFKDSYGQKQLCLTGTDETCYSPTK